MTSLEGKVAWITGGGKGIGRAIALALAARGVRVLVTGRDEKALGRVVGEIANGGGKARHLVADVRDAARAGDAVTKAVDTFGALDIVVANAGKSARTPLGSDVADPEAIFATNLIGAFYTFNAAIPRMRDHGRLIAMSHAAPASGFAAYSASKAGLLGLVRAGALELAPRKITCNAIVPSWVDTDMTHATFAEIALATGTPIADVKTAALAASNGKLTEPEEIAALVLHLCQDGSNAITGQALTI